MSGSSATGRPTLRRGLLLAIGVAAVSLGLVVAARIGTLGTGSAAAATSSPAISAAQASVPPTAIAEPTATAAPATPQPTAPPPTPALVPAPLTGLLVTEAQAEQHPIAVMVDDHVLARPQSGFNEASIVWHAPAEGGVPRYMMIFQDQLPGSVGPIRSARQYFIEWASELKAMYVHHGGSPQAKLTLASKGNGQWVYNADGFRWEGRYVFRTKDRAAPHNVYTDGEHLRELAARIGAKDGPIEPSWTFGPEAPFLARPVGGAITVNYAYESITYRYDRATNTYIRYAGSTRPQVDRGDGRVVAPKNVVVILMRFGLISDTDPHHRLEAADVGKGVAYIATNGVTVKGTWKKASVNAPTLLFGPDGRPAVLTAGQTFVQVLPTYDSYSIKDGAVPRRPSRGPRPA